MKLRGLAALCLGAIACAELAVPGGPVSLSLTPAFHDAEAAAFADNADRLRVRVERDSSGTFRLVKDTTVQLDADGSASLDLAVVLLQSPQAFRVLLEAIRSSDGAVLFSGADTVQVTNSSSGTQAAEVPVRYTGPAGTRLDITPNDTAITAGASMTFRSRVTDDAGDPVPSPVNFLLVTPGDSTRLTVNRLTGGATARAGSSGFVLVYGSTPNGLRDTSRVFIGLQTTGVRITPGHLALAVGGTGTLQAAVLDQNSQPITGATVTWASRNTSVATVSEGGSVSAVAAGTATMVATSGSFGDSVVVAVGPAGAVFVTAVVDGRTYRSPAAGDTVVVEFGGDMAQAGTDKLASYNIRYTFDPARLAFVDTLAAVAGAFSPSAVNTDSVAQGVLRFAGVNPSGKAGAFSLLRARFRSVAAGAGNTTLVVREASGPAPTLTNLLSRVTVINGTVTVRP